MSIKSAAIGRHVLATRKHRSLRGADATPGRLASAASIASVIAIASCLVMSAGTGSEQRGSTSATAVTVADPTVKADPRALADFSRAALTSTFTPPPAPTPVRHKAHTQTPVPPAAAATLPPSPAPAPVAVPEPAPAPATTPPPPEVPAPAQAAGGLSSPLAVMSLSSPYGYRTSPITGQSGEMHTGQDFAAACGTTTLAAASGTVVEAGWHAYGGGNRITVDHGNGLETTYNHLSAITVSTGAAVAQGQPIGSVGTTGSSTGCHLHFEVYLDGTVVDPMGWLG